MDFFYKYGPVETVVPWYRPSWDSIYAWWEDFKKLEGVEDYDFYVVGGSLYDIENTWDADVAITGEIKNFKVLGELLKKGRQMGFDSHRLYVDIFWYDSIRFCYEELKEENARYYLKGTLIGDEVKIRDGVIEVEKPSKDGLVPNKDENDEMVFYFIQYPSEKHLSKPEGYNSTPPVLLKK